MKDIIKIINNERHYVIPDTDYKYYINKKEEVYSIRINDYLKKRNNTIAIKQKRVSTKTLLIDALQYCIDELIKDYKNNLRNLYNKYR